MMKKKYLAMFLICLMCGFTVTTACGKESDSRQEEDDDDKDKKKDKDKDKDKDDDEDDEDEDEEETAIFIDVIDEDDLADQIAVVADNLYDWALYGDILPVYNGMYGITDLDHNGRIEVMVLTEFNIAESVIDIYEVNEKGTGLETATWNYTGLDYGGGYPDLSYGDVIASYLDAEENLTHYSLADFFYPEEGDQGMTFIDLSYRDGVVTCYRYAAMLIDPDTYMPVYLTDDGTEIEDDYDMTEYIDEYSSDLQDQKYEYFGFYIRSGSGAEEIFDMDEDDLVDMLTASYYVFVNEYDLGDFNEEYNPDMASYSYSSDDVDYDAFVGDWYLDYADMNGETVTFDPDEGNYMILSFLDDMSALVTEYYDGDQTGRFYESVGCNDGDYYFVYDDKDALGDVIDYEVYTVVGLGAGDTELTVTLDFYSYDDGLLGGYTLYFTNY